VLVAQVLAHDLLSELPERWRHTAAVAARTDRMNRAVAPRDVETLLVAAWLHDIGYSPSAVATGFHPLDGARYLSAYGWPARICSLVAHHSAAALMASARGLDQAMGEFPIEISAVADVLTLADQTVGPNGESMTLDERLADRQMRTGRLGRDVRERSFRAAERRVSNLLAVRT
jgi:putative nucleotidyltransferase with HDIG domain